MIRVALLRHAATDWNAARRLQGRADIALSASGRASLADRRLPPPYRDWPCFTSPLRRALQTAELLGCRPRLAAALIELDWGAWEGRTLAELRAAGAATEEAKGLDMRPPGGETPREVGARVLAWLRQQAGDLVAVTHKGVIRAVLADAWDWPMLGPMPVRVDWACLQVVEVGPEVVQIAALNVPLAP